MDNWYKKIALGLDDVPIDAPEGQVRYTGMILADVWVPQNIDPDKEYESAIGALSKRLSKIEGDASIDTGYPSSIRLTPQGLKKNDGELV